MLRTALVLAGALALLAPATASAAPSCLRGGGKLLAADGNVRVVSLARKPQNAETRRDLILGCRSTTGRRFVMFASRDFGLDLIERDRFTIVDRRYIGFIRDFEGGASESQSAATFDVVTRKKLHDTEPCDSVDQGDFGGIEDAVFLPRGGIAYACNRLRIADAKGDRELEPPGTDVRNLAVSLHSHNFNARLYWVVVAGGVEQAKTLDLSL